MNLFNPSSSLFIYRIVVVFLSLMSAEIDAEDELDFSFLKGLDTGIPEAFKGSSANVPGEYLVDVIFNNENYGRHVITISNGNKVCLNAKWLTSVNLPIDYAKLSQALTSQGQCFYLSEIDGGISSFDYARQLLSIQLPQIYLVDEIQGQGSWDYGVPGFILNYSVNGNKSFSNNSVIDNDNLYGSLDLNINYDRWILKTKTSGTNSNGFSSPDLSLSSSISKVNGDLVIGKTFTRSTIVDDFSFYGVSLRSNWLMTPWTNRGYAPVIDGVLNSNARVTVKQGDYILYADNLPAGPYSLSNIPAISNGEITVIVEKDNQEISTRYYPVTTLPTLLRPSNFNYSFSTGIRERDTQINGVFGLASLDYGFDFGTTHLATVLHRQYQSLGYGLTLPIWQFGAISTNINMSRSLYNESSIYPDRYITQHGVNVEFKYAKSFSENTNVQLLSYQYSGPGYEDFSTFNPNNSVFDNTRHSRYEAVIEQNMGLAQLNFSAWTQKYRVSKGNELGFNVSISRSFERGISTSLSSSYTDSPLSEKQYSISLNMSVPLDFWGIQDGFSTNNISYDSQGQSSLNSGASFSSSSDISHNVNANVSQNEISAHLYTGVRFDAMQTGFSISKRKNATTLSASATGVVAGVAGFGVAYSNQPTDTLAIAHIKDMNDVKFNGSIKTNHWGNAIIPLSPYQSNDILIDTNDIPEYIDVLNEKVKVTPSEKAIIVKDFSYNKVYRYLLRAIDSQGLPLPFGSQVTTPEGINAGFVANDGVIVISLPSKPKYLNVKGASFECILNTKDIISNIYEIKELPCKGKKENYL